MFQQSMSGRSAGHALSMWVHPAAHAFEAQYERFSQQSGVFGQQSVHVLQSFDETVASQLRLGVRAVEKVIIMVLPV